MKTNDAIKKLCAIIFVLFTISFNTIAQGYWILGGNTNAGPPAIEGLLTNSNFFGGSAGGTASLQFGTGGTTYMFIGGSIVPANNGLIGMGNGFLTLIINWIYFLITLSATE